MLAIQNRRGPVTICLSKDSAKGIVTLRALSSSLLRDSCRGGNVPANVRDYPLSPPPIYLAPSLPFEHTGIIRTKSSVYVGNVVNVRDYPFFFFSDKRGFIFEYIYKALPLALLCLDLNGTHADKKKTHQFRHYCFLYTSLNSRSIFLIFYFPEVFIQSFQDGQHCYSRWNRASVILDMPL